MLRPFAADALEPSLRLAADVADDAPLRCQLLEVARLQRCGEPDFRDRAASLSKITLLMVSTPIRASLSADPLALSHREPGSRAGNALAGEYAARAARHTEIHHRLVMLAVAGIDHRRIDFKPAAERMRHFERSSSSSSRHVALVRKLPQMMK